LPVDIVKEITMKKEVSHVIAKTMERYLCFRIGKFNFIDSMNFLGTSIEKLGEILEKSNAYEYTKKYIDPKYHHILNKKLKFPYEWFDSYDKLNEHNLPSIDKFYSHLKVKQITESEYEETIRTFNELNCKNINEYLEFYNKMDVLILADAITNFRRTVYKEFQLDPVNFISSPACAWKCALKKSKVKLEYIKDHDMLQMFERGIRGGMCGLGSLSYAEIKDQTKESIVYIDS
jgi:hypothetical protein